MRNIVLAFIATLTLTLTPAFAADFQKGLAAAQSGDYVTALKELKPLAEQGGADAQFNLGVMYANGLGVPQDEKQAVKWYRLAAKQGYTDAQLNLGMMYANGQGVPQDEKEAVKWYRLAAEQGNAAAHHNLGVVYANGQGVPQDEKEAVKWYRLAAEQGNAAAQYNLSLMYANGQGVPQDDKEAVKWTRMAAEQGYAAAQLSLGVMYANGQGVPQDEKEAAKWMIKGRATTEPQAGDAAIKEPTADPEIQIGAEYIKEEHGDWKIVCIRTGKNNKPNCRVFQLLKDESGSAVAKLSLLALSGEAKAAASVNFIAPLGTLLSAHVAMRIDAADAKRYPFVWCEKRGCVTRFGLTQPELENLKKGNQAIMTIVSVGAPKQPIGLVVSLKDFTAAWDSLVAMNAE